MEGRHVGSMLRAMEAVAPGSPLRDGLDRILQSGRGALIILGDSQEVLNICSGGFLLDAAFTPQRLSELAKMDGAIILGAGLQRIARANVHLVPNPNIPTSETGTRHRTAERVARSLSVPVVAVSESRKEIQIYVESDVHHLLSPSLILERSNQAIQTLERYRDRLDVGARNLSLLEVGDQVRLTDVIDLLQATQVVVRISKEIERNLVELGTDGRLVRLQLEELMAGVEDDRRLLIADYLPKDSTFEVSQAMETLAGLTDEALFDDELVAKGLHLVSSSPVDLKERVAPRGYRFLSKLKRVNTTAVQNLVEQFGMLSIILNATTEELIAVEGVSTAIAKAIVKRSGSED